MGEVGPAVAPNLSARPRASGATQCQSAQICRRITRWKHEHLLEAVQQRLDASPEAARDSRDPFGTRSLSTMPGDVAPAANDFKSAEGLRGDSRAIVRYLGRLDVVRPICAVIRNKGETRELVGRSFRANDNPETG
jgi:hypothetical protein